MNQEGDMSHEAMITFLEQAGIIDAAHASELRHRVTLARYATTSTGGAIAESIDEILAGLWRTIPTRQRLAELGERIVATRPATGGIRFPAN